MRFGIVPALLVLLVIILIVVGASVARARYDTFLTGYWVADAGFLERSELSELHLYIEPPGRGGTREGYLIMTDLGGEFLANQAVELTVRGAMRPFSALRNLFRTRHDGYRARLDVDYGEGAGESPPLPTTMNLSLSTLDGTLTLYGDGKVWAFLQKDHEASTAADDESD